MKHIDESRFQRKRPEPIAFQSPALPDTPPDVHTNPPTSAVRPDERTENVESVSPEAVPAYVVRIPAERRKTRHPFDIYADQLDALRKIQLAEREIEGHRGGKTLGEMAQEALDHYIEERVQRHPDMMLKREV